MNNVRPQPKAKYQLLLENSRSPFNTKRALVVAVLIVSIIGATSAALFLAWESLTTVEDTEFLLHMVDVSKHHAFKTDTMQYRANLYGKAIQNNLSNSSWIGDQHEAVMPAYGKPSDTDSTSLLLNPPRVVCYYNLPTTSTEKDLQPEKIDPTLCTHINIAFARVFNDTIVNSRSDGEVYRRVVNLKLKNPLLKVMLSLGGGNGDTNGFSSMVASRSKRQYFINSTLSLLAEFGLDGVDFDWEFPSWPGDAPLDRSRFTQLLNELRLEINKRKLSILISVAVAAPQTIVDKAYDIPSMAKSVDFVNVMSYDYHLYVWYLPQTGINSPLYPRRQENGFLRTLNVNQTVWYWIQKGMPADKIVLGMPTYGHSFTLVNSNNNGIMAPAAGNGMLGGNGFISYPEACWFITDGHASGVFDRETRAPYAFRGNEWISYDDEHSLSYKAQYVVNNRLGGAMIYSLNQDDYSGSCSKDLPAFPLTRQVANVLQNDQL